MDHDKESNTPKPKRNYLPLILLILCFIGAALAGALFASSSFFEDENPVKRIINNSDKEEELIKAKDKVTVMIMGVDIRKDDVGRSDTLMIAAVDPRIDQATLLSIPRDTRVKIRGHGYDKINAAFAYGGSELTRSTVENFLGINIDHYVMIDTSSFVKIIDAIGGVDINVEKRMFYEDPWDDNGGLVIDLYPGKQHMDGKTAVTYVRYRDSEGDIGRVKRQQEFMSACLDKVTSPEIVPRIPKIVREIIDAVNTDMSLRQLLEVAGALKAAAQNGLETEMVPGYPLYIDDVSYWIPDVELLRISVADALGIRVDPRLRERFEREAREYKESIPEGARDNDNDDNSSRDRNTRRYDERNRSTDNSRYDERNRSADNNRYDERRSSTDNNRYDELNRSADNNRYDERNRSADNNRYDERRSSTDNQPYEDDLTRPTVNKPFEGSNEPKRDSNSRTRD